MHPDEEIALENLKYGTRIAPAHPKLAGRLVAVCAYPYPPIRPYVIVRMDRDGSHMPMGLRGYGFCVGYKPWNRKTGILGRVRRWLTSF